MIRYKALVPISDLRRFEAKLRERESIVVEYVIPDVQYKQIQTDGESGVLAVLVPESPFLPHRVNIRNDHHFYIRAGGACSPLPLAIVEDMFSRRMSPRLEVFLRQTHFGESRRLRLCLRNSGKASARAPFVVISLPLEWGNTGYELDGNRPLASWLCTNTYLQETGRFMTWNDGNKYVIHPGQELELLNLQPDGYIGVNVPVEFKMKYFAYADGMAQQAGEAGITTT